MGVPPILQTLSANQIGNQRRIFSSLSSVLDGSDNDVKDRLNVFTARSQRFREVLSPEEYTALARAADFGDTSPSAQVRLF